jgi:hydroxymethylglutaryl-CoA reductase
LTNSRLPGFYRQSIEERIRLIAERGALEDGDVRALLAGKALLPANIADRMIENVIGVFGLPFAVAPNFVVNGKGYLVPMVVEEPSIVAAVSGAAKTVAASDGFIVESGEPILIGQVQLIGIDDPDAAVQSLYAAQDELLAIANDLQPNLVRRGGGARELEFYKYRLPDEDWTVVIHLLVDTRDAMGANLVNTMCEGIAARVEEISGGNVVLRILSNLADRSKVVARATIPLPALRNDEFSAEYVRDSVVLANEFANADPYRATTHNKGIMNGIDAVAIATGNDWRAIEAGAHAFAVREGKYRALTEWSVANNGDLEGILTLPLKVGIVGGSLASNPGARTGLALTGVESATELAELMGAVGLAQNFAALRALVSKGIQHGHMRLHARSAAAAADVPEEIFEDVVAGMIESGEVKTWKAEALAAEKREAPDMEGAASGRACGKVILLGEHAAVYGRHALAVPIEDAVRVSVREGAPGVRLAIPDWGIDDAWTARGTVPEGAAAVAALVMKELGAGHAGYDIRVTSRIPIGMGLGSSAAFAVAAIRAFAELLSHEMSDLETDRLAFRCEQLTHGTPSGIDNNIATFGEPVLYSKGQTRTKPIPLPEPLPLVVAASSQRGSTKAMVAGVRERYEQDSVLYETIFNEIDEMSVAAAAAIGERDFAHLGAMMNVCHGFLNALQVSTPELEAMVATAREAGAIGAKLTGAGGGGSIVALCPGKVTEVAAALDASGWSIVRMETGRH